ncbi:WD40-like Beta Propeller Repeat [Flavobacterium flevense]|uniref:Cell envelope biogenesis protein OmpA n=1 Tax=Flavobacterium flevense TaxID=983 RepID=A0A4Y4AZT9_9FLAO|nr:OmpA family protein [Flavobacterium flevense]GEC73751.1 cell envelope biogenesis protein OmpA [Flavobacterium flevense]SHL44410.1 WD40-like Beta Propeller Repeat [Flavobacterium flevense]
MKKYYISILLFGFFALQLSAQVNSDNKADKEYDRFAYIDAIKTYERMYERGYKSPDMLLKLANAYYFNGDLENAAKYYKELYAAETIVKPEFYYRFAQSLKSIKEYEKADEMMARFNKENGNDLRAKLALTQKDYLEVIKKNSGRYIIENAGINSEYSDYGSSYYKENLVFTTARDTGNFVKRMDPWTGEGFTNLYQSSIDADGSLKDVKRAFKNLNTKFHESTPVFTKDGTTVYFTRNNYNNGKRGKNANETTLLKVYKATLKGESWDAITELPFNSNNYSVAHPALSFDEKTMYFASDMPGTLGQSDIYQVSINEDGTFGTPENLGKTINTEGRETFPFSTEKNELYFASDGHPGLGGLDVFVSKARQDGSFKEVLNVGEPLNSSKDDFGFLFNTNTKIGYVTSNRDGGLGGDDIYKAKETRPIEYPCEQFLAGTVADVETGEMIENAKVSLYDSSYKLLKSATTNAKGEFDFGEVDCEAKYYIKTEKEAYNTDEISTTIADNTGKTIVPVTIEKTLKKVTVGDDIAKAFGIKIIYFDLNKYNIRPDAALELSKILDVMVQNPTIKIDIRSHTDSRNTAAYNEKLSERRAASTKEWLIQNGVNQSRLTAKGYGESQLVNKCADGVECTEEEHQANRRSEFVIVSIQ